MDSTVTARRYSELNIRKIFGACIQAIGHDPERQARETSTLGHAECSWSSSESQDKFGDEKAGDEEDVDDKKSTG
jgi:hypothetical protein